MSDEELERGGCIRYPGTGLVARETGCCSFFTFTLTASAGELALEVAVAAAHVEVLDALAARAESVSSAARS